MGLFIQIQRLPSLPDVAIPTTAHGFSCQSELNATGNAEFTINLDDPEYVNIGINDIAQCNAGDGEVFSMLIEQIVEHTLDPAGGSKETATYSGRGNAAVLEWAVVAPAFGDQVKPVEDDSTWDWRSPRYDPDLYGDSWASATEICTVDDAADSSEGAGDGLWPTQPMADRFTLGTGAFMIAEAGATTELANRFWRLYYRDITITVPGRYGIEMLMDDSGFFWVNGQQQYEVQHEDGFKTASFKQLELTAGTHRFCWAVFNFEDPDNPGSGLGPAALAYNLYKADLQWLPLEDGDSWVSDSNTKVLYVDDDPWPGMTVGDIVEQMIAEAQDRGAIPFIETGTFDETEDSDGASWDRISYTTKTGTTTILQVLEELVAAGRVEQWRLTGGMELELYAPGYSNTPLFDPPYDAGYTIEPAPALDPNTGQLLLLDRVIT